MLWALGGWIPPILLPGVFKLLKLLGGSNGELDLIAHPVVMGLPPKRVGGPMARRSGLYSRKGHTN